MKRCTLFFCLLVLASAAIAQKRDQWHIPDIPGYVTLKCDLHIHTVFSDGQVWPTVRVREAMAEELDAIAITEHIEYRPFVKAGDVNGSDRNRAFELASENAKRSQKLIVIPGSEITRDMPPGHFNAIFIKDANALETADPFDALMAAKEQGAYIFWNHPAWTRQAPTGIPAWHPLHTKIYDAGLMMGIEMFNGNDYSTVAHRWALDKNLAFLGNSDCHQPNHYIFPAHRNMTLVFARERSAGGIREALDARRTLAYSQRNEVAGREELLRTLFENCVRVDKTSRTGNMVEIALTNLSSIEMILRTDMPGRLLSRPLVITLAPFGSAKAEFTIKDPEGTAPQVDIDFTVENFLAAPGQGMKYRYTVK
ncbi:MAG: histidinol-phosphatase [Rikenellaceae bacterium]|jgi:predicted metal-dependent phosphoesterase TrpH|nr:histidinol-phosphatase [Rikenellaceae bacterium]